MPKRFKRLRISAYAVQFFSATVHASRVSTREKNSKHGALEMTTENRLIAAPKARKDYLGEISAMTEFRWRESGLLPQPIRINRRCYYREQDLLAFQEKAEGSHGQ